MFEEFDKKDNQIRQNGLIMSIDEVVDLLNSLSKENEKLRKHIKILDECQLSSIGYNLKLYEENEQLKSILYDTIEEIELNLSKWDKPRGSVRIIVDEKMYGKIKEILRND